MENNKKLDFALIGAQKCATSWMYYCLRDHPQICVPDKKLEAGYIGGAMFAENGDEWFFDRFHCTGGQIKGDVSVEYLFDLSTPEALAHYLLPRPKLLVSLRNPVDRIVSGYFWLIRRGILPNLPIEEGLAPVLAQRPGFPDPLDGPLEEVVRRSCYGPQLDAFADRFGPDALCVVLYDDVARDGLRTIRRIYDFLGVDAGFTPPSLKSAPKRDAYNPALLAIESRFARNKVVAKLVNYTNQGLLALSPSGRRVILPEAYRRRLEVLFAPCVEDTAEALGRLTPAPGQRPDPDSLRRLWGVK